VLTPYLTAARLTGRRPAGRLHLLSRRLGTWGRSGNGHGITDTR
jgi:hypothetical protein